MDVLVFQYDIYLYCPYYFNNRCSALAKEVSKPRNDRTTEELAQLKSELGILPDVKTFDPAENDRLLTGIDTDITKRLKGVINQTSELRQLSIALDDPKLKPKVFRYLDLKRSITKRD